ncbi:MAG: MBL fold metallo-hydrolase [Planctomycetota bacterium]
MSDTGFRFLAGTACLAFAASLAPFARALPAGEARFVRGDADGSGGADIADAVRILLCKFAGIACADCEDAADVDDDGAANVSDPIYLLRFLFLGGPPPPAPWAGCGTDPTADAFGCRSSPGCGSEDGIPTSRGELTVVPIEHASLVLLWDGKAIYVDPVGTAAQFAGLPPADLVLVTHDHSDHLDATSLKALVREGTPFVVPQAVATALAGSGVLEAAEETILANGETTRAAGVGIEAVPMYNITPERLRYHPKGRGNGYVLDCDGARVYISGDTEDTPEMRALREIDLAFICMNLPPTMTGEQAASAVLEFRPKVVYPYHYRKQEHPQVFRSIVEAATDEVEVRLRDWYP